MNTEGQLKEAIILAIEAGKEITLQWDCGGDQSVITVLLDGEQMSYDNIFAEELELYLVNKLNLPDVGDFSMKGVGKLLLEEEEVFLEYESRWKGYEDYDEDLDLFSWKEVDEIDKDNSGKIVLFDE